MNKYELHQRKEPHGRSTTPINKNEIAKTAVADHVSARLKSFMRTDANKALEGYMVRQERKGAMTWIEKDGKLIPINPKDLKKK
jgi:flagellar biosynthesis protein FliP